MASRDCRARNDLANALAGNVLEAAGFIDVGGCLHQHVGGIGLRQGSRNFLDFLRCIHDAVGGAGGLGNDFFQFIGRGREGTAFAVLGPQRADFQPRNPDVIGQIFQHIDQRVLLRRVHGAQFPDDAVEISVRIPDGMSCQAARHCGTHGYTIAGKTLAILARSVSALNGLTI